MRIGSCATKVIRLELDIDGRDLETIINALYRARQYAGAVVDSPELSKKVDPYGNAEDDIKTLHALIGALQTEAD